MATLLDSCVEVKVRRHLFSIAFLLLFGYIAFNFELSCKLLFGRVQGIDWAAVQSADESKTRDEKKTASVKQTGSKKHMTANKRNKTASEKLTNFPRD